MSRFLTILVVVLGLIGASARVDAQFALGVRGQGLHRAPTANPGAPPQTQPLGPGVVIDFDDLPAPSGFASAIALREEYAALGVHFDGPGPLDGGAILDESSNFDVTGQSSPNFLAFNINAVLMNGGIPQGPETITFDFPLSSFQINAGVGLGAVGTATVDAFDSGGALVDTDTISVASALQTLSVAGADIRTVVLSFSVDLGAIVFDDLVFEAGGPSPGIFDPSYTSTRSYNNALCLDPSLTTVNMTFDGVERWSTKGGSTGQSQARYDAAGTELACYDPLIDFRSIFTVGGNTSPVYARGFSSQDILVQTSPGVFAPFVTLTGGPPESLQNGAVYNTSGTEFLVLNEATGVVLRYDLGGNFLGSVTLNGYGTVGTEAAFPQNRTLAAAGGYYLTYSDGNLSAWDPATGNRVGFTQLVGAGIGFGSHLSLSFAQDQVWIVDDTEVVWRGYSIPVLVSGGPVIKNQEPFCGALAFGVTVDRSTDIVYVQDAFANQACTYDLALNPLGAIPGPPATSTVVGIAWNSNDGLLYWNEPVNQTLWVTDTAGNLVTSFGGFTSPGGGLMVGMTFDQNTRTLWLCDRDTNDFYEFTENGVFTGNFFHSFYDDPPGTGHSGWGIAWREDNRDFEIPGGPGEFVPPIEIAKVDSSGNETGTERIDIAQPPFVQVYGLAFHPAGSDGRPTLYVADGGSNFVYEINALAKPEQQFVRGDVNRDGAVNIADAVYLLNFLFVPGSPPPNCDKSADVNRDCAINIADAVYLLNFLFVPGSPPPSAPFPDCGIRTDCPNLTCDSFSPCP